MCVCVTVIGMGTKKSRKEILEDILDQLKENNGKMTFGQLLGYISWKYGTTKRTFDEYLKTLYLAHQIDYPSIYSSIMENNVKISLLNKKLR